MAWAWGEKAQSSQQSTEPGVWGVFEDSVSWGVSTTFLHLRFFACEIRLILCITGVCSKMIWLGFFLIRATGSNAS